MMTEDHANVFTGAIALGLFAIAVIGLIDFVGDDDGMGLIAAAIALGFILLSTVRQ